MWFNKTVTCFGGCIPSNHFPYFVIKAKTKKNVSFFFIFILSLPFFDYPSYRNHLRLVACIYAQDIHQNITVNSGNLIWQHVICTLAFGLLWLLRHLFLQWVQSGWNGCVFVFVIRQLFDKSVALTLAARMPYHWYQRRIYLFFSSNLNIIVKEVLNRE